MTIGSRINAATQAARQVIDMAGNALVRQPGHSGLTGRRAHGSRSLGFGTLQLGGDGEEFGTDALALNRHG
jgi:hypothetical protein